MLKVQQTDIIQDPRLSQPTGLVSVHKAITCKKEKKMPPVLVSDRQYKRIQFDESIWSSQ